ncbi:MAG TPA: class I adenylate-forming enzyme family protein [Amycolatopsis sp.]|uniref:class I adenylate-forming enzyme family protein n=1 Tax=Amycolatopsis sp. TaxID=37632 RepID=UPI002B4601E7|nr:class I adenylate-forming enzyme family protein [Amycolatopsis sp.]HKS48444.1 class I adenylate-forming enzyme family protein [Amycolatopsis sp.]
MLFTHKTVLTPELRARVAADAGIGGGNLLPSLLAINPCPDEPFIRSLTPVPYTDGETRTEFSLRDLDHLVQSWSAWYWEKGVRPRDRVAIFLPDSIAYFVHYSAIAQLGAVAMLINSNAPRETAVALCERTGAIALYTNQERLDRIAPDLDKLPLRWTATMEEVPSPPSATLPEKARFRHHPDDPVGLMHSSGTTGLPKPTIHTHRTIVAGPKFRAVDYKEDPNAVIMTAMPQSHQGCIAFTSYAVLGGQPFIPWRDVPGEQLAAAIAEHRPTMVMAFGHVYPEMAALKTPPGALDSVNFWVSIADAVHERHMKNILSRRSKNLPPSAFLDRLGTTELGWGVLMQPRTLETVRNDRCVGRSVGFAEVSIVRENGTLAEPYEYGFLGAKPPSMTPGYWGDPDTTYRSMLAGYWLTGDIAYRDEDGLFYQVDRAVDVVHTTRGRGYSVQLEELVLNEVAGVDDCTIIAGGLGDEKVAVAVVTGDVDAEKVLFSANEVLRANGKIELAVVEVASAEGDFPLGLTGKSLKRFLRDKYKDLVVYVRDRRGKNLAKNDALV